MKISIMGTGYVGLSTGVGFAKKGFSGEIFNLGNPEEFTLLELANLVKRIANSKSEIIFKDLPRDDPLKRRPDITKARKCLGWSPEVGFEEGLKKTIGGD